MPLSRSQVMARVKSRDTKPELALRALLRRMGHPGYRLCRKELPGRPDIAYIGRRRAIFLHGCFWHGHACRRGAREPKANAEYWRAKIARNRARDAEHLATLAAMGWRALVIWECEMRDEAATRARLAAFLGEMDD